MKIRTFVSILILVLAVLIITGSCATGKKAYVAKEDEELYGTWVNTDYDVEPKAPKLVLKPDGTYNIYSMSNSDRIVSRGDFTIRDKWTDADGNIWYRYVYTNYDAKSITDTKPLYALAKIDPTGNTLERVFSGIDYPHELGPDLIQYTYEIHYRQE